MVSFFKDKSAVSVFWLIILCCALHFNIFLNPPVLINTNNNGLCFYLLQPFTNLQPYTISVIYILIIFLLSLQINFVVNDLHLLPKQSYTPALAFVLLSALVPVFNNISPALLSCNFLIWILYSACKLYSSANPKRSIYNIGFLAALSVIMYYPMLPLVIAVCLSFFIMRPFRPNEFFILLSGILTPVYFLVSYLFIKTDLRFFPNQAQIFNTGLQVQLLPAILSISLAVAALVTLWSMFTVQQSGSGELIQVRKSWTVTLIFFLLLLPGLFFMKDAWPVAMLLPVIPASAYLGFSFGNLSRSLIPNIIFWLLVGFSIYNNWFAKY